jgi:hypothetical protein
MEDTGSEITSMLHVLFFFSFFFDQLFIEKVRYLSLHLLLLHWTWGSLQS